MTFVAKEVAAFVEPLQQFAAAERRDAPINHLISVKAFRQLHRDEVGGAVPYDQPICEELLSRAPAILHQTLFDNHVANWLLFLEFETPVSAQVFVDGLNAGKHESHYLIDASSAHGFSAFRNMRQYSRITYDPALIHFFNLFLAPGDRDKFWQIWQQATPGSLKLPKCVLPFRCKDCATTSLCCRVNPAHWDSLKHFIHGAMYDTYFQQEVMQGMWFSNGVELHPFFCKIVSV